MVVKLTCGKGAENLSADDKLVIDKILKEYEDKILKHAGGKIDYFEVHVKCHLKDGNTKRFSIEARLGIGKYRFETSSDDWNLTDAMHKLMKTLMSEIDHKITREKDDRLKGKMRN
jgi:hypothetical protein